MPWYQLVVRGRLAAATAALFPGFRAVEEPPSTVLWGHLDRSAGVPAMVAELQALGAEIRGIHQVPGPSAAGVGERPPTADERPGVDHGSDQIEVVVLRSATDGIPATVCAEVAELVREGAVEVLDLQAVRRQADGTFAWQALGDDAPLGVRQQIAQAGQRLRVARGDLAPALATLGEADHGVVLVYRRPPVRARLVAAAAAGDADIAGWLRLRERPAR